MSHWSDGEVKTLPELTQSEIEKVLIDNPAFFHDVETRMNNWTIAKIQEEFLLAKRIVGADVDCLFYHLDDGSIRWPSMYVSINDVDVALRVLELLLLIKENCSYVRETIAHLDSKALLNARNAWEYCELIEGEWRDRSDIEAFRVKAINLIEEVWNQYVINTEKELDVSYEKAACYVSNYANSLYENYEIAKKNGLCVLTNRDEPEVEPLMRFYYADPPDHGIESERL